jgi:uncharacterized protein
VNDQERQVIADIFRRLEGVAHQPRDPEAERFIAERLRQQPYAPYAMAQSIFVQEQALANLNAELEALRAEVAERRQPQGGGFLSSIFGGGDRGPEHRPGGGGTPWGRAGAQARQPLGGPQGGYPPGGGYQQGGGPMQGGPWGGGMMQPRGGGFLQGALATAAGVAGGMMVANALTNAFSGDEAGAAGGAASAADLAGADSGDAAGAGGITDGLYQDASANPPDDAGDFGGDFGGDAGGDGGDWA